MNTIRIKAYAKINLTLEIVGNTGEYHALDSLVSSVDIFDSITLKKRKDTLSSVRMHGQGSESIPPERNNALKAAELFSETFGTKGADITVYKNIPMGAGLGGSSADSAGVLRGMAKLYGVNDREKLDELADRLGSDTKYMLRGGFMRMRDRGTKLIRTDIDTRLDLFMLLPFSSVSSGACYQKYDELKTSFSTGESTEKCIEMLRKSDLNEAGRYLTNDLFLPAAALDDDVLKAVKELKSFSPLGVAMTGSGSAAFALFETKELCEWAKSRYKGKFRAIVTRTVVPENEEKSTWRNPFILARDKK